MLNFLSWVYSPDRNIEFTVLVIMITYGSAFCYLLVWCSLIYMGKWLSAFTMFPAFPIGVLIVAYRNRER